MALAYRVYTEKLLCPDGCGYMIDSAWDADMDGWYEATPQICYATAARERYVADNDGNREYGELVAIKDTKPD